MKRYAIEVTHLGNTVAIKYQTAPNALTAMDKIEEEYGQATFVDNDVAKEYGLTAAVKGFKGFCFTAREVTG